MITLDDVKKNAQVRAYIRRADANLAVVGYTEHGFRHCGMVAKTASNTLLALDVSAREAELSAIAGFLHDIGNVFNRYNHPYTGAVLAHTLLRDLEMDIDEITMIVSAIGNHDDDGWEPVSAVSAGLILADKSDVHKSRVRNPDMIKFDIHDRVNYAVNHSELQVDKPAGKITLSLTIDLEIASVMEYFEIFLSRMLYCKRAAHFLKTQFSLMVNGNKLL